MKFLPEFTLVLILLAACNLPKDSQGSWASAKENGLRVGVVENPPFCYKEGRDLKGSDIQLLSEFARIEGLDIHFEVGSETLLIQGLKDYEFQVVAGGFKKNTVWARNAGLSTTYLDQRVMLIPRGENELLRHLDTYLLKKHHGLSKNL